VESCNCIELERLGSIVSSWWASEKAALLERVTRFVPSCLDQANPVLPGLKSFPGRLLYRIGALSYLIQLNPLSALLIRMSRLIHRAHRAIPFL
jgi:hypothetical protein